MTPEQKKKMPWGWYEAAARKKGPRVLEDFQVFAFEAVTAKGRPVETEADMRAAGSMTRVSFGIVVGTVSRGPGKGLPKWAPRCKIVVDVDRGADKIEMLAYEASSGLCGGCVDGVEAAGWSVEKGPLTRPCTRCGATGRAPATAAVVTP